MSDSTQLAAVTEAARATKTCAKCGGTFDVETFDIMNAEKNTRHLWCRECVSSYKRNLGDRKHPAVSMENNPSKRALQHRLLHVVINNARRYSATLRVVCLPGKSGWDVEYFLKHGATEVFAIERDTQIAAGLKARFASDARVHVVNSHTCEFFNTAHGQFDIVYLDYYSTFTGLVRTDIRTLFRRRLISERGKLIVAFYAAREAPHDTIEQAEDYYALCRISGTDPEDVNQIDQQRMRMLAFNGFIAGFRVRSPIIALAGHPDKLTIGTGSPSWWSYETAKGTTMLVVETPIYTYKRKVTAKSVLKGDCWHARGRYSKPKHVALKCVTGAHTDVIAYWADRALQFYNEHGYTPVVRDLGPQSIAQFKAIIKRAGLCPRKRSTLEEVKAEIMRISAREGYVSKALLKRAKIIRKIEDSFGKTIPGLLSEMGVVYRHKNHALSNHDYVIKLTKWIDHLSSGQAKMKCDLYFWARSNGLLELKVAREKLRLLMDRLSPPVGGESSVAILERPS